MQAVAVAPDLVGRMLLERLLKHMPSLQGRLWLVDDDVPELGSHGAWRQLRQKNDRQPAVEQIRPLRLTVSCGHPPALHGHATKNIGPDRTRCHTTDLSW